MHRSTGSNANASPRKALVLLAVFIALCAGYANLSFFVHDRANFRFFPPFQAGYNGNFNLHLGAEYVNIARALVGRRGFSDPFGAGTGPTAWMPPVYPVLIAALLWLLRAVHRVAAVIVLLQCLVLWLGAYVVTRICRVVPTRVPAWLPLVFYGAWLTAYFDWFFQVTHDTWIIMLFVELLALGLAPTGGACVVDGRSRVMGCARGADGIDQSHGRGGVGYPVRVAAGATGPAGRGDGGLVADRRRGGECVGGAECGGVPSPGAGEEQSCL